MAGSEDIFKQDLENSYAPRKEVDEFINELGLREEIAQEEAAQDNENRDIVIPNPADQLAEDDPRRAEVTAIYNDAQAQVAEGGWTKFIEEKITPMRRQWYEDLKDGVNPTELSRVGGDLFVGSIIDNVEDLGNFGLRAANFVDEWMQENGYTKEDFVDNEIQLDFANKLWPEVSGTTAESLTRGIAGYLVPLGGALKVTSGVLKGASALAKGSSAIGINAGLSAIKQDPDGKNLSNLIQDKSELLAPIVGFLAIDDDDSDMMAAGKTALESALIDTLTIGASKAVKPTAKAVKESKLAKAMVEHLEGLKKQWRATGISNKFSRQVDDVRETAEKIRTQKLSAEEKKILGPISDLKRTDGDIIIPKESKKFGERLLQLGKENPEILERVSKGRGELIEEASETLAKGDPDKLFERIIQGNSSESDIVAMEMLYEESLLDFADVVRKAIKSGDGLDKIAVLEMQEQVSTYGVLSKRVAGDAGAKLRLQRHGTQAMSAAERRKAAEITKHLMDPNKLDEYIENVGAILDLPEDQLIKMGDRLVKKTAGQKIYDAAVELRTNSLLSGLGTQSTSLISATVRGPMMIGERYVAAKISARQFRKNVDDALLRNKRLAKEQGVKFDEKATRAELERYYSKERVFEEEVSAMVREFGRAGSDQLLAAYGGIIDFLKLGNKAIKSDRVLQSQSRVKNYTANIESFRGAVGIRNSAITAENFGIRNDSWYGSAFNKFGSVLRAPSWFLSKGDQITGMMHYRMQANAYALREAKATLGSLPMNASADDIVKYNAKLEDLQTEFFEGAMSKIDSNNSKVVQRIRETAVEQSDQARFLNEVPGWANTANKAIKDSGPLRLLMPFSRVELNILTQAIDRTPGMAHMTDRYKEAILAGGTQAAEAQAKVAMGTSIGGVAVAMAGAGLLTGPDPKNATRRRMLKESGWQPNSFKIGDTYVSYDKLGEPYNRILKFSARLSDIAGYMYGDYANENTRQDYEDLVMMFGMTIAESGTPEFLTEGFGDIIQAVEGQRVDATKRFVADFATSVVLPYSSMMRSIRKEVDPVKRVIDADPDSTWSVLETMYNNIQNTVPGLSENLPPQRNIFGEEVMYPPGLGPDIASPVYTNKVKNDPVISELLRLGVVGPLANPTAPPGEEYLQLKMPSNIITVNVGATSNNFKMKPEQYDRMIQLMANNNDELGTGSSLYEEFKFAIEDNIMASDQEKRVIIKEIYELYKSQAKLALIREDESIETKMELKGLEIIEAFDRLPEEEIFQ